MGVIRLDGQSRCAPDAAEAERVALPAHVARIRADDRVRASGHMTCDVTLPAA